MTASWTDVLRVLAFSLGSVLGMSLLIGYIGGLIERQGERQ
jgi:hypothetical protein